MSRHELRTRAAQEIAKRWDVARHRFGVPAASATLNKSSCTDEHFFFDSDHVPRILVALRQRMPEQAARIIHQAERICTHHFDLLGYENLDFGRVIDWRLDPVHGKRAPRKAWFQIRFLDFTEVGDHKITWELNRHQHLTTLAKAYLLTNDRRFTDELTVQWYHWQEDNPYPIGINWASSLEVAFRSLSWLWVKHLLGGPSDLPGSFGRDLDRALAQNAWFISRFLSTYFAPNTHLLGEAVALFFIGTLCPQFRTAHSWREHGWSLVLEQAQRQVREDGMHFEQSIYYHVYALDFFLHARILASRNKIAIPAWLDATLIKMLKLLRTLAQGGTLPRFGDDDGGRLFDPRRNRSEHMLDPLATGQTLFGQSDMVTEESLWLLGPDTLGPLPPAVISPVSVGLASAGFYALVGPERQQLVIDAGPQGAFTGGHGHADALSIQVAVDGAEWLIDPGTFCYISNGPERNRFRGTSAHNTLQVDGCDQAEPAGPFAWRELPKVTAERWITGRTFDLFVGSHNGYYRLPQPVVHRRWVFGLKGRFWLVRDLALGEGAHRLDLFWHFPARVAQPCAIVPVQGHGWLQQTLDGACSPVYGRKEPAPVLRFSTEAELPVEFATVVTALGSAGTLEQIQGGYRYVSPAGVHEMYFLPPGRPWSTDAEFLCYSSTPENGPELIFVEGSYVAVNGERIVSCENTVPYWESIGDSAALRAAELLSRT